MLRPRGRLLLLASGVREMFSLYRKPLPRNVSLIAGMAGESVQDLRRLAELAAAGVYRPHVGRVYPFGRIREAHAHVDTGHKQGSVVLAFDSDGPTATGLSLPSLKGKAETT